MTAAPALRGRALAVAALCALAVAVAGGLSTEIGPWYLGLQQPAWKPPDPLFGPAWTLIYAFTVMAAVEAWRALREAPPQRRRLLVAAFAANALLNVLWSVLFFKLQRPDWALYEVGLLWGSILMLALLCGRATARAGWLMLPYLAWVAFAALLNASVVRLNAPF